MVKILLLGILILLSQSFPSYSQKKDSVSTKKDSLSQKKKVVLKKQTPPKKDKEISFMDKVQKIIEIRRSFDVSGEITKPALLALKKDNGEKAIFSIDIAIGYKGFRYEKLGFTPLIQFDYSSKEKDRLEKIRFGLDTYYKIYEYSGGSGKLRPFLTFAKDYYSKIEEFNFNLSFVPSFPKFVIPVRNISDIKFKYDGNDNRWIFGFNPIIGTTYERIYGGKKHIQQTNYYSLTAASVTVKRYYLQFDVYGKYEKEFIEKHGIRYKYEGTATLYFDEKERSSINAKFEQSEKDKNVTKKFTLGFGIKL